MKRTLMTAVAVCSLAFAAGFTTSNSQAAVQAPAAATTEYPATAEGAAAFIAATEAKLAEVSEYAARVQWVRATYITYDTMWLEAKVNAEATELQVQL
ncbi:MAG: peptidase M2 family protein, partial [Brevundimonas sp.]